MSNSTYAIFFIKICSSFFIDDSQPKFICAKESTTFLPGKSNEWHVYTKSGNGNDFLQVFKFENNVIHVSGEDFGYIVTKKKYANFHLTVEFKWGEKKYPPRENEKRDAGYYIM